MSPRLFLSIFLNFLHKFLIVNSSGGLPDIPIEHFPFFINGNQHLSNLTPCDSHKPCSFGACWGYEENCDPDNRYKKTRCEGDSQGWTNSKSEQEKIFFDQADFGYIKSQRSELTTFCQPISNVSLSSKLECTKFTRFCRASNIFINFKNLGSVEEPMRYRGDVLSDGDIGGVLCNLDKASLHRESGHKSPLQSWFEEIEHYTVVKERSCDIMIERPTYIMKLDATVNMYHHFCDFINLFLTMHLNNSFNFNNNIVIWDTIPYRSNFGSAWKAFTDNPIMDLSKFSGKVVCFNHVVFPLLPRMIFGMYYNMPLIPGCSGSGVFHAFNRHLLHRMQISDKFQTQNDQDSKKIRITIISRKTRFRKILNEKELVDNTMKKSRNYEVQLVNFNHQMPFSEQVKIVANTDILIGIHGAGLTHCLFLPDYAVLFELYNCEDEHCYKDLARLRGVKYITWEKDSKVYPEDEGQHPTQKGAHKKFTNYSFDIPEFLRLISIAAKHVRDKRKEFFNSTNSPSKHEEL